MRIPCPAGLLAFAFLVAFIGTANAQVFSFGFEYPVWDTNSNTELFGTNPTVTVMVNNGNNSRINQIFDLSSDIVSVTVMADGGSYSNTWLASEISTSFTFGSDFDYLSTDANGLGTLDLGPVRDSNVVFSNASGTQSFLTPGPNFDGTGVAFHSTPVGFTVIETVPEPSSIPLLIAASAVAFCRRR